MIRLARLIATLGGLGRFPVAPGTIGSLAGVAAVAALAAVGGTVAVVAGTAAAIAAGWASAGVAARSLGRHDPGEIVVDELAGQMLALVAFLPTRADLLAGFVLFRLFDILKPPPVRQAEKLPGASGIMADDLIAGLCANMVWRALRWLLELG